MEIEFISFKININNQNIITTILILFIIFILLLERMKKKDKYINIHEILKKYILATVASFLFGIAGVDLIYSSVCNSQIFYDLPSRIGGAIIGSVFLFLVFWLIKEFITENLCEPKSKKEKIEKEWSKKKMIFARICIHIFVWINILMPILFIPLYLDVKDNIPQIISLIIFASVFSLIGIWIGDKSRCFEWIKRIIHLKDNNKKKDK